MRSSALADTLGRLSEMGEGLGVEVETVEAGGNDTKILWQKNAYICSSSISEGYRVPLMIVHFIIIRTSCNEDKFN